MRVVISSGIGDLARDMTRIAQRVEPDMRTIVRDGVRVGRDLAHTNANRTAGKHGRRYPSAITSEVHAGAPGGTVSGEYGPETDRPQGDMSFEYGSRNQPPHLDLAKSADIVGPAAARSVNDQIEEWFW